MLPNDLRRRLLTVAGTLELVDREFDSISSSIDDYRAEFQRKAELGDLDVSINSVSLIQYMGKRFKPLVELGVAPSLAEYDEMIISQLVDSGINTIEKLENIIPKDYIEKKKNYLHKRSNFCGILNDLIAILNVDRLVGWLKLNLARGVSMPEKDFLFLKETYGIDIEEICKKNELEFSKI